MTMHAPLALFSTTMSKRPSSNGTSVVTTQALSCPGSGALELIATVRALQEQLAPPTIGFGTPAPECDLDYALNRAVFRGIKLRDIKRIILLSDIRSFEAGEAVIRQGEVGRDMFLILRGTASVIRELDERRQRLAELGPGTVFGKVAFVDDVQRTATVQALEPTEVLVINHEKLNARLSTHPRLAAKLNLNISRILGHRLAQVSDNLAQANRAAPVGVVDAV